jgi:ABC-type phosphate transport system permease subunit
MIKYFKWLFILLAIAFTFVLHFYYLSLKDCSFFHFNRSGSIFVCNLYVYDPFLGILFIGTVVSLIVALIIILPLDKEGTKNNYP